MGKKKASKSTEINQNPVTNHPMIILEELFCPVDDFYKRFEPRSPTNFVVHFITGLIAYYHLPNKPYNCH